MNSAVSAASSMASAPALSGLLMRTSGSMTGSRPWAEIRAARSNCCATMASTPSFEGRLITDRIFVP